MLFFSERGQVIRLLLEKGPSIEGCKTYVQGEIYSRNYILKQKLLEINGHIFG